MSRENFKSIVDLLDSFFGGPWTASSVDRLSESDLDALASDVSSFYRSFRIPPREIGKLRSYSGGAAWFRNYEFSERVRRVDATQVLPFAHASLLYCEEVVLDCPLDAHVFSWRDYLRPQAYDTNLGNSIQPLLSENVYGKGYASSSVDENKEAIRLALSKLEFLSPGIRKGWLLPVPHLRYWKKRLHQIEGQVRRDNIDLEMYKVMTDDYIDPPAMSDMIRGGLSIPTEGIVPHHNARARIETPSIYFNSILAVADEADARPLPTADSDVAILRRKIVQAADQSRVIRDGLAVSAIHEVHLPTFDEDTFETICEIRASEAAFADWRNKLQQMADGQLFEPEGDVYSAQQILIERVEDYTDRLRAEINRSSSLSSRLDRALANRVELGVDLGLAAATWLLSPAVSVIKTVSTLGAPLLRRAVKSVTPEQGGAASVLVKLDRPHSSRD